MVRQLAQCRFKSLLKVDLRGVAMDSAETSTVCSLLQRHTHLLHIRLRFPAENLRAVAQAVGQQICCTQVELSVGGLGVTPDKGEFQGQGNTGALQTAVQRLACLMAAGAAIRRAAAGVPGTQVQPHGSHR